MTTWPHCMSEIALERWRNEKEKNRSESMKTRLEVGNCDQVSWLMMGCHGTLLNSSRTGPT